MKPISRITTLLASAALVAGGTLVAAPAQAASSHVSWTTAKVVRWVDGDTVKTTKGTVRLIGVDTPERGRCGAASATARAKRIAPVGSKIRLGNPRSVVNRDRYDRKLRYVKRGTVDISRKQIKKGAKARYDGRDGYQWHPRQASYRRADRRNPDYTCAGASGGATSSSSWSVRANSPVSLANPDLDCADIPTAYRPIRITGPDYHRLDADGDGWGCDW